MKVILLERITRLGNMGDVVDVKAGYARNFLLPQEKALRATNENVAVFESQRAEIEARNNEAKAAAQTQAKEFDDLTLVLARPSSDEGKLFGSVTVRDIAEALEEKGKSIPKSLIRLLATLKTRVNTLFTLNSMLTLMCPSKFCLLYTSPSPRDRQKSRMPSSA